MLAHRARLVDGGDDAVARGGQRAGGVDRLPEHGGEVEARAGARDGRARRGDALAGRPPVSYPIWDQFPLAFLVDRVPARDPPAVPCGWILPLTCGQVIEVIIVVMNVATSPEWVGAISSLTSRAEPSRAEPSRAEPSYIISARRAASSGASCSARLTPWAAPVRQALAMLRADRGSAAPA